MRASRPRPRDAASPAPSRLAAGAKQDMTPAQQALLGALAGALSLLGFMPYIVEIVQGKTRPNRATWWIWTVVGAMLSASYYASGSPHAIWVPLSYVVGPLV